MCSGSWPNFDAWYQTAWGAGQEFWSACPGAWIQSGTNLVFGTNPPYYLDDFLAVYSKFFGLPTSLSNCTTDGSAVVQVPSTNGLGYGQFIRGAGLAPGSVIIGLGNGTVTLNQATTVVASNVTLQVYQSPPVPTTVIQLYLNLAVASLVQARWQDSWYIAVAWYIAHYLTLYAKSDASEVLTVLETSVHGEKPDGAIPGTVYSLSAAPPGGVLQSLTKNGQFLTPGVDYGLVGNTVTLNVPTALGDVLYATWPTQTETFTTQQSTGAAIAAQGLAGGIQTSKSVGDVSVSYSVLSSLESWGQWNLTSYGQQLTTMAAVIGSGPMVIWTWLLAALILPHLLFAARLLA